MYYYLQYVVIIYLFIYYIVSTLKSSFNFWIVQRSLMPRFMLISLLYGVTSAQHCTLTEKSPSKLDVPLSFCNMFLQSSCCDPTIDAEIAEFYTDLVGVSDLCAAQNSQAHIYLRYYFCFGCNPKQMHYTDEDSETITVCPNFARKIDPANFDDCGLLLPGERGDICSGDDVVFRCFSPLN